CLPPQTPHHLSPPFPTSQHPSIPSHLSHNKSEWNGFVNRSLIKVPASNREADLKEGHGTGAEDGEHEEHDDRDDDLDDENIFTCDNCQHDFDCLAELTEHRTNHCPA
ncbi:hypothetical protein KUCAC02_020722, partial [Chaenocephalus aceratus]